MFKKIDKIIIFILSIFLLFLTNISLIYFDIPNYIYSNVISLYLLGIYFSLEVSLIIVTLVQVVLYSLNQVDIFFSYSFLEIVIVIFVICILKYIIINKYYIIVAAVIILSVSRKLLTLVAFNILFSDKNSDFFELISLNDICNESKIQMFSAGISVFIIIILSLLIRGNRDEISKK